jgi:large subunit ribosomal protein L23
MRDPYQIVKKPLVTEKGSSQTEHANQFAFEVAVDANKVEIKQAVESLFKVKVLAVNTMLRKGKSKGLGYRTWQRPNSKRALVTLAEGQQIEFI